MYENKGYSSHISRGGMRPLVTGLVKSRSRKSGFLIKQPWRCISNAVNLNYYSCLCYFYKQGFSHFSFSNIICFENQEIFLALPVLTIKETYRIPSVNRKGWFY